MSQLQREPKPASVKQKIREIRVEASRVEYKNRIGESAGSLSMQCSLSRVENELGWQDVDCR